MWQWTLKRHWQDPICLVKSCLLVQSGPAMECPGCDRELATLDSTQTLMIRWDSINVTVNPRHWQETLINWLGLSLCRAMEYPVCERSLPHFDLMIRCDNWWAADIDILSCLSLCQEMECPGCERQLATLREIMFFCKAEKVRPSTLHSSFCQMPNISRIFYITEFFRTFSSQWSRSVRKQYKTEACKCARGSERRSRWLEL